MDPKKQDLTPELKQIYDRVMNTQVKTPAAPATPTTGAATTPSTNPAPSPTAAAPTTPATPAPTTNLGALNANKPATPATGGSDTFLSSAPPRPLNDDKTFVFTGNKVTTPSSTNAPAATATPGAKTASKLKLSPPIIGVLVVAGVLVWGVVWAKVFGLI